MRRSVTHRFDHRCRSGLDPFRRCGGSSPVDLSRLELVARPHRGSRSRSGETHLGRGVSGRHRVELSRSSRRARRSRRSRASSAGRVGRARHQIRDLGSCDAGAREGRSM
jgi:hypothetical protein